MLFLCIVFLMFGCTVLLCAFFFHWVCKPRKVRGLTTREVEFFDNLTKILGFYEEDFQDWIREQELGKYRTWLEAKQAYLLEEMAKQKRSSHSRKGVKHLPGFI